MTKKRCSWAVGDAMILYHDTEWGRPQHDDNKLYEFLVLEGVQAGLSWSTILNRREGYRAAFDGFDPHIVSTYDEKKIQEMLLNPRIIRNRLKVKSAINNAVKFCNIQKIHGTFDSYIWG
ncbi:MAG: DNA-3-methyladenine glycosylase I, partial [Cenarchaeum sp. SB0669_bin_11]|nr:DNA-3-methyladenine glycosylase I [Cenarchaeum sp. SB0669_bin_11]